MWLRVLLSLPVNLEEDVVPLEVEKGWFELLGFNLSPLSPLSLQPPREPPLTNGFELTHLSSSLGGAVTFTLQKSICQD